MTSSLIRLDTASKQMSSRHEEILENLAPAEKLVAVKKGSLGSTMKKTVESTEQAWTKAVKFQDVVEKIDRCRVLHTAEAKKVAELRSDCKEARRNWDDVVTDREEAKHFMEECQNCFPLVPAKKQAEVGNDLPKCTFKFSLRNHDRLSDEQALVVEMKGSRSRCCTALLEPVVGFPPGSPPSSRTLKSGSR